MSNLLFNRLLIGLTIFGLTTKAQVVQDDWVAPALPDYSTTITIGSTFVVQWDSNLYTWFAQYAPLANSSNCALWITGSEANSSYQSLIENNINVQETTSATWLANVPTSELQTTTSYNFRFLPLGASYTDDSNSQISSPIFVLALGASSSTTTNIASTTSSQPTSTTSSQTSTSPAPAASSSAPPAASHSSSSLSGGAIAGIVIGAVAVILLAAIAFLLWRRKSNVHNPPHTQGTVPTPAYSTSDEGYPMNKRPISPGELDSRNY